MFSVMANKNQINEEQRVAQAIAIDHSSSVWFSKNENEGPKGFEKFFKKDKKKEDGGKSKEAKKDSEKKEKAQDQEEDEEA